MPEVRAKRPLTQLNQEVEAAESEVARLESERQAVAKDIGRATRELRYLQLASRLRAPAKSFAMWPMAVMMFGPLLCGIVALIVVHVPTGSYPLAFFAFLLGTVAGVGVFGALIYHPADTILATAMDEAEAQVRLDNARLQEKLARITEVKDRLQLLLNERRDQIASGKLQRAALLQRPWKTMNRPEWEDFVVEVLRTHGAKVERAGRLGGEDANLIADFEPRRVAVFTTGEGHPVASSTIQQAIAAKNRYGCDSCAVVINRRFTGAAQDFARRNGCAAIGTSEFPDFVMGKVVTTKYAMLASSAIKSYPERFSSLFHPRVSRHLSL
jgi:HJR/Mrr/RecB family endonuclease